MAAKETAKKKTNEKASDSKATNATPEDERFMAEHRDELSPSTQRAKWIHSPDEHADRDGQTLATQSHEVIQH